MANSSVAQESVARIQRTLEKEEKFSGLAPEAKSFRIWLRNERTPPSWTGLQDDREEEGDRSKWCGCCKHPS